MAFLYDRSQLKSRINAGIHGRIGIVIDEDALVNDVARAVIGDIDLRSSIRKGTLTPKLFNGVYEYTAPSDLKGDAIIDIPPQVKRDGKEWFLTSPEQFDQQKEIMDGWVAVDHYNNLNKILLAKNIDDESIVISEMDSITSGGGTWVASGDAENIERDSDDYVKGGGSLSFDISSAGGTTCGLKNLSLNSFDIDEYLSGNGAIFVWTKINSITNLTSFTLRIGQDESNFYYKTVTTAHDNTAFVAGWNLLRFDLTSLSETGSPANTGLVYADIFMNKAAGKISETDYHFDWMVLKRGQIFYDKYYSKYPWVSAAGTWLENSTADTDLIVADTDEYELYILKGKQMAAEEANEFELAGKYEGQYLAKKTDYIKKNPSNRKVETEEYYKF